MELVQEVECLLQVGDEVLDAFDANRRTEQAWRDDTVGTLDRRTMLGNAPPRDAASGRSGARRSFTMDWDV